ncbi:MAG: SDR family oxidoreductase [Acidobacteriota bacterium]|nr:SDR family oxidoreductase [Acidobacteriota bacterium]
MHATPSIAILGATGGLGRALSRRLRADGARLFLGARDEAAVSELAKELESSYFAVDGADFSRMDEFLDWASADASLQGVVNCAGSLLLKPAHRTTFEDYQTTIAANLTTAFATVRSATRVMSRSGGSIVLVSSAAASIGLQNHEAIAAAKAGVAALARTAAASYSARGIRVNAIAPGMVETPLTASILSNPSSRDASLALHPSGRPGQPEELAGLIAWLLSPESTWVTGQVWGIDGGLGSIKLRPVTKLGPG